MAQYDSLARWYDPLYASLGKDFAAEADALLDLAARHGVEPGSLLDVACGTGQHLARFRDRVEDVAGMDLSPEMLDLARERLEGVPLRHGDMRRFDLGRTFDVVTCLFSAIGHLRDAGDLDAAMARMAAHVAPGGLLLVEPWLTPELVDEPARSPGGHRSVQTATTEDGVVARTVHSVMRGEVLVLQFGWAVADAAGVRVADESFRMPVFSRERLLDAVRGTGLEPSWEEPAALRTGRGLLVGRRAAA